MVNGRPWACSSRWRRSDLRIRRGNVLGDLCSHWPPARGWAAWLLTRSLSLPLAKEMARPSQPLSAKQAFEWRLINGCVPAEQLETVAAEVARKLATLEPPSSGPAESGESRDVSARLGHIKASSTPDGRINVANVLRNIDPTEHAGRRSVPISEGGREKDCECCELLVAKLRCGVRPQTVASQARLGRPQRTTQSGYETTSDSLVM